MDIAIHRPELLPLLVRTLISATGALRLLVALVVLCSLTTFRADAKTYVTLNGKIMTCEQAFKFRDGPLATEFNIIFKSYSQAKVDRQKAIRTELAKHIADAEKAWEKASEQHRRVIRTKLSLLALARAAQVAGKYVDGLSGASAIDKQGAKILIDKGNNLTATVANSWVGALSTADVAKMIPASAAALLTGPAATAVGWVFLADAAIDVGFEYWDKKITDDAFSNDIATMKATLDRIIDRSADIQIERINAIKEDIDKTCK